MEIIETALDGGQKEKPGLLDYRIENNHYVARVRWKDGKETENHFPVDGFDVVNPKGNEYLGSIGGEKALEILQEHAGEYDYQDFSWRNFV
jgi:hypothetical protein